MASIIVCDLCDSRKDVSTQHYQTGVWQTDPAGGRSEQDVEIYDLCQTCELKILRRICTELSDKPDDKDIIKLIKHYINSK